MRQLCYRLKTNMLKDNRPYNIVVIEDNEGDFFLLQEYVMEKIENPNITRFIRFSQFETYIKNTNASIDAVILDLSLPDKNGLDLVQSVIETTTTVPVIVLTGYSDIKIAEKSIDLGVSKYVLKDEIDGDSLYQILRHSLENRKVG